MPYVLYQWQVPRPQIDKFYVTYYMSRPIFFLHLLIKTDRAFDNAQQTELLTST